MARGEKGQPSPESKDSGKKQNQNQGKKGQRGGEGGGNNSREARANYGANEHLVEQDNNLIKQENNIKSLEKELKQLELLSKVNAEREKQGYGKKEMLEPGDTFDNLGNKTRVEKGDQITEANFREMLAKAMQEYKAIENGNPGSAVETRPAGAETSTGKVVEQTVIPAEVVNNPEVQQGAWNRFKSWTKSHPRLSSFVAGMAGGMAVRTAAKLTVYASFGASLPATIGAGAIGGGVWEGIRKVRQEAVTYQSKEILTRFNNEPDVLKKAAMLTQLEDLMRQEKVGGNQQDFANLRSAMVGARTEMETQLDARDGRFASMGQKDKITYLLNKSKGIRGGIEKTAQGKEAEKLLREIKESLEYKREYGNVWKNKKAVVATSMLRGAAYGALGGAIGGALVNGIGEAWNWFGGSGATVKSEVISTVTENRPTLKDAYTARPSSKGLTGASRDAIHQYLTDYAQSNPGFAQYLSNNNGVEKLVYAEDFLKDNLVKNGVSPEGSINFTQDQLNEALNKAGIFPEGNVLTSKGVESISELIQTKKHFLSEATKQAMLNFPAGNPLSSEVRTIITTGIEQVDGKNWIKPEAFPALIGLLGAIGITELGVKAAEKPAKRKAREIDEQYYGDIGKGSSSAIKNYPPIPKPPGTPFDTSGNGNPFTPKDEPFLGMNEVQQTSATSTAVRSKYREEGANQTQVEDPRKKKGLKPIDANFEQDLGSILGGTDKEVSPIPKPNEPLPGDLGRDKDEVIEKKAGPKITYQGVRAKDTANVEGIKNGFNEAYPVLVELGIKNDIDISFNDQNRTIDFKNGVFKINMPPALKYTKKSFDKLVNEILNIKTSEKLHEIEGAGSVTVDVADQKEFIKLSPGNRYRTYDKIATALSSFTGADKIKYLNPLKKINIADYSDITPDELSIPMFLIKDGVWVDDEDLSVEDIRNMIIEARSERMLLGTSLENEAPDVTERNMNKAELFKRFPNVVAGASFNKLSLEVRKRGVLNFINSAKEFINGFPYDVKIKLGNKTDVQDGVLQLDISKDRDGISKDLHAGLRLARKKFLLENSGKEVKVEKFDLSNEETDEILENIKDTGKGAEALVENLNTALEKTEPIPEFNNELGLGDWLANARRELGTPMDASIKDKLKSWVQNTTQLLSANAGRGVPVAMRRNFEQYSKELVLDKIEELVKLGDEKGAKKMRKNYNRKFNK